ncbi:L-aspartate oxidase [Streptomyces sp. NPDC057702]|uniref:L-aspartate oxidase n=1 Tax=unclassified Streptomyces TaxID=2593676 RepID=UPI0036A23749
MTRTDDGVRPGPGTAATPPGAGAAADARPSSRSPAPPGRQAAAEPTDPGPVEPTSPAEPDAVPGSRPRLHAPAPGWAIDADVVVVGSGVAGLTVALRCAAAGASVTVVTKARLDDGSTRWAQGGIAAALGEGDTPDQHEADTLVAGAGLCDEAAVRTLVTEGPGAVHRLIGTGARFDSDADTGAILLTREGGHHRRRIAHAGGDATGAEISRALVDAVRAAGPASGPEAPAPGVAVAGGRIETIENALVLDLLRDASGRAAGVTLHVMGEGRRDGVGAVRARSVVLATGGMGQVFSATTNPAVSTGDGVALALRAGAEISDLEFVQFHPTVLWLGPEAEGQQPLVSEAVRGEGAYLVDDEGIRFMVGQHELAELAPRDIVAKGITRRMLERGAPHMYLDARHFGATMWERRFPTILAACRAHGIDPVTEPIPVAPAAHYASGGVRTDLRGRTTVPGLYACGEVACTGVHGANRLASNSLLEGLVFAERIAADITPPAQPAACAPAPDDAAPPHPAGPHEAAPSAAAPPEAGPHDAAPRAADARPSTPPSEAGAYEVAAHPTSPLLAPEARFAVQRIMTTGAGVLRSAASLRRAARELESLHEDAARELAADGKTAAPGVETWEATNLLLVARVLVAAALRRAETRGCHWREDHPDRDDTDWNRHLLVTLRPDRALTLRTTPTPAFPPVRCAPGAEPAPREHAPAPAPTPTSPGPVAAPQPTPATPATPGPSAPASAPDPSAAPAAHPTTPARPARAPADAPSEGAPPAPADATPPNPLPPPASLPRLPLDAVSPTEPTQEP